MRALLLILVFIFSSLFYTGVPLHSQAIIIDHTCTDASQIPVYWLNQAKSLLRCSYGHTSHGSQLITGMHALMDDPDSGSRYFFNTNGSIAAGVLSVADYTPDGDLGNPDFTTWESRTRDYLENEGSDRNVVIWSWCGQVSGATSANIDQYLSLMNGLEQDYPGITFVYMTGHLDGSGVSGNLNVRNNQIRNYCNANNKVLFDFADIESYDPDGDYFLNLGADDGCNYSGGNWAEEWITANPAHKFSQLASSCGYCAHSEKLNCILKGNAAWWLMARIAGWNGATVVTPTITVTSPNGGENWLVNSTHNITWTYTGTIDNVRLTYSSDGGSTWTTIKNSIVNTGSYSWKIPDTPSTQCRVRVAGTGGTPSDTGNNNFTISSPITKSITVTSPNGGEKWKANTSHQITWTSTGAISKVDIEYSTDAGNKWKNITNSTANSGTYNWSIPEDPADSCYIRISESGGNTWDISDGEFTIQPDTSSNPPIIALDRVQLNYAYVKGGEVPGSQVFRIFNTGGSSLTWQVSTDTNWLELSPTSGTQKGLVEVNVLPDGLAMGDYTADIQVIDDNAANSPFILPVYLSVLNSDEDQPPFGSFDTPEDGEKVAGSIAVTGWALDDVEIACIKIYYEQNNKLIYVGDGNFVDGARPDIEQSYPDYPNNYKAGWGYMLLTHFLPNKGNGTFVLHAKVKDNGGHEVSLGTKTIICDNGNSTIPFGAIDTPHQGGMASGKSYINFGWALTPAPNKIPVDGSTIKVWVDGVQVGHPDYNHYREDIADLFPGYNNSSGAMGYFYLDTTTYENGVHTIAWSIKDNASNEDGIGSRYFTISNSETRNSDSSESVSLSGNVPINISAASANITNIANISQSISLKKGFSDSTQAETLSPSKDGIIEIEAQKLERIRINLADGEGVSSNSANNSYRYTGYLQLGNYLRPLPPGSSLDTASGVFSWQLGLGFKGEYRLVFYQVDTSGTSIKKDILVRIK